MSAKVMNEYSLKVFSVISFIMAKHDCYMKDIDLDTGIFTISGKNKIDIEECENDIYESFANNQNWGVL